MKLMLRGLAFAAVVALAPQPASADLFDNDGPLCSVLSIGCTPPPPPAPIVEPVAAPAKPVRQARKAKPKKVKATAEAPAVETPAAK